MGQGHLPVAMPEEHEGLELANTSAARGTRSLRLQHISAATGLILTYLIEIGVQIFLTVYCCRSLLLPRMSWDWALTLTLSLTSSSVLVSLVSIVWVCRGLDFAGRLCGRLLCYVMHFFLLGLVWRYLKLAFAYDHADVQEFVALRIFQAYIQSLPLTSIHLAWLITFRENWTSLTLWLVVIEAVAIATALTIASYIKSDPKSSCDPSPPTPHLTTQMFLDNLKCSTKGLEEEESVMWCRVLSIELNIVSRGLLLCARLLVIGILIAQLRLWSLLVILAHFVVSFPWISFSEGSEVSLLDLLARGTQIAYVLFWDVTSTLVGGLRLRTWALPVLLVIGENGGLVLLHWYTAPGELLVTVTSGTCLLFGTFLFSALNLLNLTNLSELLGLHSGLEKKEPLSHHAVLMIDPPEKAKDNDSCDKGGPVIQTSSSSSLSLSEIPKLINGSSSWGFTGMDLQTARHPLISSPNNYTNISEVLKTKSNAVEAEKKRTTLSKKTSDPSTKSPSPILGPVPASWGCNDSNGSSNSRNTNTLLEPRPDPQPDNLTGTHFVFCYPERPRSHQADPRGTTKPPRLRSSTPVEIRKAARVRMKGRCPCKASRPAYDLMEDSYGILICEAPNSPLTEPSSIFHVNKKLRVLCAKCLQNHDPLLTDCLDQPDQAPNPCSETTDYPSETEMTCDQLSLSSVHSTSASYTTWPQVPPPPSMWSTTIPPGAPKEFTSREYVRTWLLASQARLKQHVLQQRRDGLRKVHRSRTTGGFQGRRKGGPPGEARRVHETLPPPVIRYRDSSSLYSAPESPPPQAFYENGLTSSERLQMFYKDLEIIL